MAGAFSVFAADGVRHEPIFVTRVEGPDGEVLFDSASGIALPPEERKYHPAILVCFCLLLLAFFLWMLERSGSRLPPADRAC